jgi:hypothetical protein
MNSKIYPVSFGLSVSVEIVRDSAADIARVFVIAPLYMRKRWEFEHCYSDSMFTDAKIIQDSDFVRKMRGYFPTDI